MGVARQSPIEVAARIAVQLGIRDDAEQPLHQVVAQRAQVVGTFWLHLDSDGRSRSKAGDTRGVDRAGPHVALLAAAVQERDGSEFARQQQRADSERTAELVSGHGQSVQTARSEVDRQRTDGLDGVGVNRDAVRTRDLGELGDRLNRTDLVVRPHDTDERDVVGISSQHAAQRRGLDATGGVDGQPLDDGTMRLRPATPRSRGRHGARRR